MGQCHVSPRIGRWHQTKMIVFMCGLFQTDSNICVMIFQQLRSFIFHIAMKLWTELVLFAMFTYPFHGLKIKTHSNGWCLPPQHRALDEHPKNGCPCRHCQSPADDVVKAWDEETRQHHQPLLIAIGHGLFWAVIQDQNQRRAFPILYPPCRYGKTINNHQ